MEKRVRKLYFEARKNGSPIGTTDEIENDLEGLERRREREEKAEERRMRAKYVYPKEQEINDARRERDRYKAIISENVDLKKILDLKDSFAEKESAYKEAIKELKRQAKEDSECYESSRLRELSNENQQLKWKLDRIKLNNGEINNLTKCKYDDMKKVYDNLKVILKAIVQANPSKSIQITMEQLWKASGGDILMKTEGNVVSLRIKDDENPLS